MSKFLKALEQAQRDRAVAVQKRAAAPPIAPSAGPVISETSPGPVSASPPAPPAATRPAADFGKPSVHHAPMDMPEGMDDHLVSLLTPTAFEAEQYRALRYIVEQRHRTDGLSVLAISSAAVGDGKSVTAVNLAGTLGQAPEVRVLLIDADLRRPTVGHLLGFGTDRNPGLVDAILDPSMTLDQVALTRPPFNIKIVLPGQTPPSPYEVLKSPRLAQLLDEARAQYDYVIIDTPPLVSVQDCRVIARSVDGIILVVAAHQTPKRLIEEALNLVDPSKMLGFVFNGDDQGLGRLYTAHGMAYASRASSHEYEWSRTLKKLGASFARPDRRRTRSTPLEGDDE